MSFNCVCINALVTAADKMARLPDIRMPEPDDGFRFGNFDLNHEWIVWTELKRLDPGARARRYNIKVFRGKTGENDREELLNKSGWHWSPSVFIASDGTVLISQRKEIFLVSSDVKSYLLESIKPLELFPDGMIATIKHTDGKGKVVFYKFTAEDRLSEPIILEEDFITYDHIFRYHSTRFVVARAGNKVVWINGSPLDETDIVLGDIVTGERTIIGKGDKSNYALELDGLYGEWLFCHQGTLARLININNGKELQFPIPGTRDIRYFCPYGLVFTVTGDPRRLPRRPSTNYLHPNHYRFWDPVLNKKIDFLCAHNTAFTSELEDNHEFVRIYLLDKERIRYFSTNEQMVDIPPELVKSTAAAIKRCMDVRHLEKNEITAKEVSRALPSIRWPYPPETITNMELMLNSYRDTNTRRSVARRIGYSNDPVAKKILLEALKSEKHGFVKEGLYMSLAFVLDKEDAAHIIEQQQRGGLIGPVANTLGILGNISAMEYLKEVSNVTFSMKSFEDETRQSVLNAIKYIAMRNEVESVLSNLRRTSQE